MSIVFFSLSSVGGLPQQLFFLYSAGNIAWEGRLNWEIALIINWCRKVKSTLDSAIPWEDNLGLCEKANYAWVFK